MPRTINFLGSVALLVSSITGPSLVIIPLLYQQAGWLTPLLTFTAIGLLSGTASLFIVEIMSSIEGNEAFQASIEFTTIAHLFLGKRWHVVVQILLYLALETLVIASLLESFQSMDAFLVNVAHKTCAISFTDGWICVSQIPANANSAFSGYILGSFGTLITICLILPLSLVQLVDNIIFQVASFIVLLIITLIWIVVFALVGLDANHIPVVGSNQSTVAGFVLSNFSFVITIPAWVNNTHPSVNIRRAVWLSIIISCLIYIPIGWMGSLAYNYPNSATLLQVFTAHTTPGTLGLVAQVSCYVFPLAVLISSIPVFAIVVRYNLLRGNICSNRMAIFLSAILPWLITIPFQTNDALATILNWASLVFTTPSNLIIPFILFIVSKRHLASAVLDANVCIEMPPVSDAGAPPTPIRQTATPTGSVAPVENIPVVIITDSTDPEPEGSEEMKMRMSTESKEGGNPPLAIQMPVRNRVLSPSKHRYYGREPVGDSTDSPTSAHGADHHAHSSETVGKTSGEAPKSRRPSLSVSLSHSHSILHSSNTGMDEFLLISPTSPEARPRSVRTALSVHSPRPSISTLFGSSSGGLSPEPPPFPNTPSTPSVRRRSHSSDPAPRASRESDFRITMPMPTIAEVPFPEAFKAFPRLSPTSPFRSTRISAVGSLLATALVLTAIVYDIVETASGSGG